MHLDLRNKLQAMLWDFPEHQRIHLTEQILTNPFQAFQRDQQLLLKALNSLKWYDLMGLLGKKALIELLSDQVIQKLFPAQRRTFYSNARRLLSKYSLSTSG